MEDDRQYGYDGSDYGREPDAENPETEAEWTAAPGQEDGGYQQEYYRQSAYQGYSRPQKYSNMALASLIMGIIGIVTSCCCYGGLIFGSLGILFALLSKMGDTMEGYAKAGLVTSIMALVLAVLVVIVLFGIMGLSLMNGGLY